MKINLDPSFAGVSGMLKVWNATGGALQVTDEGHLLSSHKTAWVKESPVLVSLINEGFLTVVGEPPKKVSKSKAKQEEPAPIEPLVEESVPVAPAEESEPSFNEEPTDI